MRHALTGLAFAASLVAAAGGTEALAVERSGWSRFHDPERHMSFEFPAHIFQQEANHGEHGRGIFDRGWTGAASSVRLRQ